MGQFFAPYLPQRTQPATGLRAHSLPEIGPQIPVVWLSWKKAPGSSTPFGPEYVWTVFDADGCETRVDDWYHWDNSAPKKVPLALALHAFPRWGRRWGLRLYKKEPLNAPAKAVAEFPLPPIGQVEHPDRTVPIPRLTAREGELEFELLRFVTGADYTSPLTPPIDGDPTRHATYLKVAAKRNGRSTRDWMPVSFQLGDSTGNFLDAGASANPIRQGNVTQLFLWQNLFAESRSWRVRLEVARTPSAPFRPEELVVLRNVPTPSRSAPPYQSPWLNAPRSLTANGMSLECRGISWDSMGPPYAEVTLELQGQPLAGTRVTLLKAVDDSGRAVPLEGESRINDFGSSGTPLVAYELPLAIRKPTKSVDLTLAVQRTRFVEFQASPTRPTGPMPRSPQAVTSR